MKPTTAEESGESSNFHYVLTFFVIVVIVLCCWIAYAYKNPVSQSEQLLIKYSGAAVRLV